jgi:hypothetical protein
MLRDARGDRLGQARREASRAGAIGLAAGIGANIAALMAMTARFDDALAVAGEVEHTAGRLGLIPLQAAALLMQGFAMAHQGRASDMERYLAAAEAAAPDDADLRAGAWGIGRGIGALLAEDRSAARQAFARARAQAPDQHARILNPYEGPNSCYGRWQDKQARQIFTPHPPAPSRLPAGRSCGSAPPGRSPPERRAIRPRPQPHSALPSAPATVTQSSPP